jgi:hypothetical protein
MASRNLFNFLAGTHEESGGGGGGSVDEKISTSNKQSHLMQ